MTFQDVPFRFERRRQPVRRAGVVTVALALGCALVATALLLLITGHNPFTTYGHMVNAAVLTSGGLRGTIDSATPLVFTGLAAAFAFRMRAWNIGGEGQLYIGAICAAIGGIAVGGDGLAVALPVMILSGMIGGAVWAGIVGLLKALFTCNEILTSLMLNYVAGLLASYLIFDSTSYLRDTSSLSARLFPQAKQLDPSAEWPTLGVGHLTVPFGFALGIVVAAVLSVTIKYTRFGYELRVIAARGLGARYAGMHTKWSFVALMLISGAVAGLGGASQVGDFSHNLDPVGLQAAAYGYTGIVVAALARLNPWGVILAALAIGGLTNAGFVLQGPGFPAGLVGTMEGVILFCVVGAEALARYRIVRVGAPAPPVTPIESPTNSSPRVAHHQPPLSRAGER